MFLSHGKEIPLCKLDVINLKNIQFHRMSLAWLSFITKNFYIFFFGLNTPFLTFVNNY